MEMSDGPEFYDTFAGSDLDPDNQVPAFSEGLDLDTILKAQSLEISNMREDDLKNHQLPLARVKKIMKSDEDVRMISAETPVVFGKACELFILELTHRAWMHTEANKRRTLQRCDIISCIQSTIIFDFLIEVVPSSLN
jgi:nuclear transcription factor Y gamma